MSGYLVPYDLPVPPQVDWGKAAAGSRNWVREIAEKAANGSR